MLSDPGKMPILIGDPGASAGCLVDIRGDLSLLGVKTPGKESELTDALIPVSFLGVERAGASHISTSLDVSESSNEMTSSDLRWFCWIEMSTCGTSTCGTSLAGTALLLELSLEDVPSPRSGCEGSGCTAFLDVSTLVDCHGLSEKEVVGISLNCIRGDATVDRFVSGCSDTGVLAFLFPRSRLESEGLCSVESNVFCSSLLDVPAVLRG